MEKKHRARQQLHPPWSRYQQIVEIDCDKCYKVGVAQWTAYYLRIPKFQSFPASVQVFITVIFSMRLKLLAFFLVWVTTATFVAAQVQDQGK